MNVQFSFFDTTPSGRILNRFSKDIDNVDVTIPYHFKTFIYAFGDVVQAIIVISISMPILIILSVFVSVVFVLLYRFAISTLRQLKRIEAKTRSPILNLLSETIQGTNSRYLLFRNRNQNLTQEY